MIKSIIIVAAFIISVFFVFFGFIRSLIKFCDSLEEPLGSDE